MQRLRQKILKAIAIIITLPIIYIIFKIQLEFVDKFKLLNFLVLIWFECISYMWFNLGYSVKAHILFSCLQEFLVTYMFVGVLVYEEALYLKRNFLGYKTNKVENTIHPNIFALIVYYLLFFLKLISFEDEVSQADKVIQRMKLKYIILYNLFIYKRVNEQLSGSPLAQLFLNYIIFLFFLKICRNQSHIRKLRRLTLILAIDYTFVYSTFYVLVIFKKFLLVQCIFISFLMLILIFKTNRNELIKTLQQMKANRIREQKFWSNYLCQDIKFKSHYRLSDCCSICLTDFKKNQLLKRLTQCGHGFHIECLQTLLISTQIRPTCPNCRAQLVFDMY